MRKYVIEYDDLGEWKLLGTFEEPHLTTFSSELLRVVRQGYTVRAYEVN